MDIPVAPLPPVSLGDRLVVRYRLPDGSATDVIGWVTALDADSVTLTGPAGEQRTVSRPTIIAARPLAAVSRGRDPLRESPVVLQRLAVSGWVAEQQPLGEWILRSGGGYTARANSCLAAGDPRQPLPEAAQAVVSYAEAHHIDPLVQVIAGSAEQHALRALGWQDTHADTLMLVQRLVDLVGANPTPQPEVELSGTVTDPWLDAWLGVRPSTASKEVVRRILTGEGPQAYASITRHGRIVALGKAHVRAGWAGLAALWTAPEQRRQGLMTKIISTLGRWSAREGARSVYLQVQQDNTTALAAYRRRGFSQHHAYGYLAAPTVSRSGPSRR
ncbi:hypothetical protein GCM10009841_32860 [Microlunatus panaciterrae]|uniref:GNAT superfamily N-acetyltransferase n=1 Tax=Microlunatus panaciterrae TaxID=400768 RepID=A0ABS2RG13_9ACTN|nr:GNAT family N-acetyltransferase [Microlunatus panaciterrae]MBM7797945.1 GNAT superfamily N-acetyltransferase [Microlunatus panaciterrae]